MPTIRDAENAYDENVDAWLCADTPEEGSFLVCVES